MIRGLRAVRYLLRLLVILVVLVMFFGSSVFNQGRNSLPLNVVTDTSSHLVANSSLLVDDDVSATILVYTPKQLVLKQLTRTLDTVNRLNGKAGEICEKRCEWTMDRNMTSNADAVVFYFFTIGYKLIDLPTELRRPNQIWAMHTREAPPNSWCDLTKLNGIFNWTVNYRKDSDIWGPYGRKLPKRFEFNNTSIQIGNLTLDQWVAGKEELVTQVVSRCKSSSKREDLVEKLKQAGLPVHVYGGCGKKLCGRNDNCSSVWKTGIGRKYKFYLAFENSICKDYISEKFWRSLELGMVPVVYGGGDYLDEAPLNSYIDVRSFSSAKELTQYLLRLDKEPEEYKEYFKWRNHYTTVRGGGEWCKFCIAMHQRKTLITKAAKVYEDLDAWYWQRDPFSRKQTACEEKPQFFRDI